MMRIAVILIACGLAFGCTGKGEPTTPSKVVTYTENNIRNSAEDAPNAARRAGKRTTKAVDNVTGEDGNGNNAEGAAKEDSPKVDAPSE